MIDFRRLTTGRRPSYEETLYLLRRGLLSYGFVWETAKHDEVFAQFLKKNRIEKP